ncbi:MAG: HAMP domain-containing sensor histidine kinase [Gemmatimonadetes bacterium]|nr:HAMP domain-containing sensor histidine kinase [Gemmatimonadota bacterium]
MKTPKGERAAGDSASDAASDPAAEVERLRVEIKVQREQLERLAGGGRLVAMLLHELGNPVSAIINYAHSLEQKVAPDLRGTVASLQREAFRVVKLRDGFLDFVRPKDASETGADLNAAVRETLGFLDDQGALRRIEVDLQMSAAPKPTRGTALELEQAIANLVLNAAAAMPEGGRLVIWAERYNRQALIEASARRTDGEDGRIVHPRRADDKLSTWLESLDVEEVVKIVVADSGHGFHHGNLEKVFEPFFSSKEPDDGVGLGLTVVRRVVDSMGGIVWAQKSREGGAAFHIVLPVHPDPDGPPDHRPALLADRRDRAQAGPADPGHAAHRGRRRSSTAPAPPPGSP